MDVTQLWRYPVKSMIGEAVGQVVLDAVGIVGDRTWAVRDVERGGIRGAKKLGGLMRIAATALDDGEVLIRTQAGETVTTDDPQVHDVVTAALGHPVRLEARRPPEEREHYRRGAPDSADVEAELRDIFGREAGEPLPDLSVFPPELLEYESPPGAYYDAFPLLVLSEAALRAIGAALPDSVVDVRRFRPSIVVEDGTEAGHPEMGWTGRRARVGSAVIEFGVPCPRCVMVTREIDGDVPADRAVLRHVVAELDQNVGIYATVVEPGSVTVGDRLTFL